MHLGLRHAEKRKEEGRADLFDRVMIVVGLVGPLSLIPQAIKVWIEKDTSGISLLSWSLLTVVALMWIFYGIHRRSKALVISNVLLMILDISVIVGVLVIR